MKRLLLTLLSLVVSLTTLHAGQTEHYFRFQIEDRSELEQLTRLISIDNVKGDTVFAYASDREMDNFRKLDYTITTLPHPGTLIVPEMATNPEDLIGWNTYPSYDAYVTMMRQFETVYPDLCVIERAGYTVMGREILYARISDNVEQNENEPEVQYASSIHGDETVGYVLMLRLIDSLLTSYGNDPEITHMIDNMEIWINPLANPDGTYMGGNSSVAGAIRYNANYVDLNRNLPDPRLGPHPDYLVWQPETIDLMDFTAPHNFVLSANFHGGAEVVNYPWDTWEKLHPDDAWFQDISRHYADTAQAYSAPGYMNDFEDGITNGYDWYCISGGRQDYMTYFRGCREVTIELSFTKLPQASTLPTYWEYNRVSLFNYLKNALYGVHGVVTDLYTGLPLSATITVLDHDADGSQVFTEPETGDFHRLIAPGAYTLEIIAENYITDTVFDVSVVDHQATMLNIELEPVYICGDVNDDGSLDPLDINYLVAFMYKGGPAPPIWPAADVDGSGEIDPLDLTYLVYYVYKGGPPPAC